MIFFIEKWKFSSNDIDCNFLNFFFTMNFFFPFSLCVCITSSSLDSLEKKFQFRFHIPFDQIELEISWCWNFSIIEQTFTWIKMCMQHKKLKVEMKFSLGFVYNDVKQGRMKIKALKCFVNSLICCWCVVCLVECKLQNNWADENLWKTLREH